MDATCILTRSELAFVLKDLKRRSRRSPNVQRNRIVFRLSCCCGLRASEICGLNLADIITSGPRPCIRVRKAIAKRHKPRLIPLWWDTGTLEDLRSWVTLRKSMGAGPDDPVVCAIGRVSKGRRRSRCEVSRYWKSAIRNLGKERVRQLSIHKGRHTFCSYVAVTKGLMAARDAAGHSSVQTTNIYLHALSDDNMQNIFG